MSYYSGNDGKLDSVASDVKEGIEKLQQIFFARSDNQEYFDDYYVKIKKSITLLMDVHELLGR